MIVSVEQIGILLEIVGVLIVLFSQVLLGFRVRKSGGLRRFLMSIIGPVRVGAGTTEGQSDEYLKKHFPELWAFASLLRDDIWTTTFGLVVTLIGLILELFNGTLII